MNTIVAPSNTVTMSSREIADLTGKHHHHVVRDIKRNLAELNIDASTFGCVYRDERNRAQTEYFLGHDLVMTLLTGYSTPLRHCVVTRLGELENVSRQVVTVPQNLPDALRLAADQAEQNLQLQAVIQKQAPKVDALNRLANTHGSGCITSAAKQLDVAPLRLFKWLSDNRWIYRRTSHSSWSAFQPRLSSGLLEHKPVKVGTEREELKVVEQVMVTRRGITTLAEQLQGNSL